MYIYSTCTLVPSYLILYKCNIFYLYFSAITLVREVVKLSFFILIWILITTQLIFFRVCEKWMSVRVKLHCWWNDLGVWRDGIWQDIVEVFFKHSIIILFKLLFFFIIFFSTSFITSSTTSLLIKDIYNR